MVNLMSIYRSYLSSNGILKYFSKAYVPTVPVSFSQKAYETIISIFGCV